MPKIDAILIAGPTASGKSALALDLARELGGEIVNADSMQVYAELRVLTARPSAQDEASVPHHLYGTIKASESFSAGRWARAAAEIVKDIQARGRLPIIVGGTGLYFRALTEGLAEIPDIPLDIREQARADVAAAGEGALALLASEDPELAARLRPSDPQRIARGLEVMRATGIPLSEWQKQETAPLLNGQLGRFVLAPERDWLKARADRRFEAMLGEGALEEAASVRELDLDPSLPIMKALGLRPLISHLAGEISREEAVAQGQAETRSYQKRQETWMRTQMIAWERLSTQDSERLKAKIFSFIDELGLTR
jgi:tRNA dimethylallyltransferase